MKKEQNKSQPDASAPGNPSTITGQNSQENATAYAMELLGICSPDIPEHFWESKPVWWLLDGDDHILTSGEMHRLPGGFDGEDLIKLYFDEREANAAPPQSWHYIPGNN